MDDKEPLFILAGNGPYENRGCEAIVRGTVEILRKYYDNPSFVCISHFESEEQFQRQSQSETDSGIHHLRTTKWQKPYDKQWWINVGLSHLSPKRYGHALYQEMLPYLGQSNAVLSIGGDNYSLDYVLPKDFTALDDLVIANRKPLAIWGASIGPFDSIPKYKDYMIKHLSKVNVIFARESATVEYLKKHNITENVHFVADPAFVMPPIKPNTCKQLLSNIDDDAIGVNLSPLMAKYVTNGDQNKWILIATGIIETLLLETEMPVYLIPHVTTQSSNDYTFMAGIFNSISSQYDQLHLLPPEYNAAETKWIISNMSIFLGARTHATIASLSSSVPTLSLAYSLKAVGINNDVFNSDQYCLHLDQIEKRCVLERVEYILDHSKEIHHYLNKVVPTLQQRAFYAGNLLSDILEG